MLLNLCFKMLGDAYQTPCIGVIPSVDDSSRLRPLVDATRIGLRLEPTCQSKESSSFCKNPDRCRQHDLEVNKTHLAMYYNNISADGQRQHQHQSASLSF